MVSSCVEGSSKQRRGSSGADTTARLPRSQAGVGGAGRWLGAALLALLGLLLPVQGFAQAPRCAADAACTVEGRPEATGRCEAAQCVFEVERFVRSGPQDVIDDIAGLQGVLDAAQPGDTVRFGVRCEKGRCEPATYVVGARGHDLVGKHGVFYDGQGATLRLQAQPAEIPWSDWRWRRVLSLGPAPSALPTRMERLNLDGNVAGQRPEGDATSWQAALQIDAAESPGGALQPVELTRVALFGSHAAGLRVGDGVSLRVLGSSLWPSRTWGNAVGVLVASGRARVELDGWASGRREDGELAPDGEGLRLVTAGLARQVTLVIRDSTVERPTRDAVFYAPGAWSAEPYHLQLDGLKVVEGGVYLRLERTDYVAITRSELGRDAAAGPALTLEQHCVDLLVRRTSVRGYVDVREVAAGCQRLESRISLDAVHFIGQGWAEAGRRFAVRGEVASCPTASRRSLLFGGRTTFAEGYDAIADLSGGRVEVEVRTTRDWHDRHGDAPAVLLHGGESACNGQLRSELRWRPRSRRERHSSIVIDHRLGESWCRVEGEAWRCEGVKATMD